MTSKVLAALALAAMATACNGGSYGSSKDSGNPYTSPGASPSVRGTQVDVRESEYSISLSRKDFAPGTYTFVIHDAGHATHALEVDGPGVSDQRSTYLDAGDTASLTVTLQAGKYRLYCPVANHASQGMDTSITVS